MFTNSNRSLASPPPNAPIFRYETYGDYFITTTLDCTCGGDYGAHEQYCGAEPVGPIDGDDACVSLSVLWDMSDIDNPLPLVSPPKPMKPRVWFGGVEIKGVKSVELDLSFSDDAF